MGKDVTEIWTPSTYGANTDSESDIDEDTDRNCLENSEMCIEIDPENPDNLQ
jgi:hypothetical protein